MEKRRYESIQGDGNPMRRPEVAAKQAASLRKTWADPERRKQISAKAKAKWTPEMRKAQSELIKTQYVQGRNGIGAKWSEERKEAQRQKMQAYWASVRAALALVGESRHED